MTGLVLGFSAASPACPLTYHQAENDAKDEAAEDNDVDDGTGATSVNYERNSFIIRSSYFVIFSARYPIAPYDW